MQQIEDYSGAEKVYRDALLIYPNKPGMILGLGGVLALQGKVSEAIEQIERGLTISKNEKQKSTMRALLCFLYSKNGNIKKSKEITSSLPNIRECRETIQPLIESEICEQEIDYQIKILLFQTTTEINY